MKAAIFYGGHDIRVEDRDVPRPGPGEVLFRVKSGGICGSDLHPYRGENPTGLREPHERGHELAGEVVELGDGVDGLSVGQRVGVEAEHLLSCGKCRNCLQGQNHVCPLRGFPHGLNAARTESHGFSQYDVCVAENLHPLPDHISYDAATQLDCYACGVHALNRTRVTPDDTVAVIGTGAIGITLGQMAKAYGAGRVVMIGRRRAALDVAERSDAADDYVAHEEGDIADAVMDLTNGEGADAVFETVGGTGNTLNDAIQLARFGGAISVLGVFTGPVSTDLPTAYRKELRIEWSNSYSTWNGVREYGIALKVLADGKVDPEPFITTHFELDDIQTAFAAADDKRSSGAVKVMVHP